ncbi:hypothetical protein ACRAWD_13110 [Caulobacter segnis]
MPFLSTIARGAACCPGRATRSTAPRRRRTPPRCRPDGSITVGDLSGSIHKIGALVQLGSRLQRLDLLALQDPTRAWRPSTCCGPRSAQG